MKIYVSESAVPIKSISRQEALDRKMFGPVYHGSSRMETILTTGFDLKQIVPVNNVRSKLASILDMTEMGQANTGPAHGYPFTEYYSGAGVPPPIHHLGFGIYLTTVRNIGRKFNGMSVKNLVEFYLDVPRLETINFGSPRKMMEWWFKNGYNIDPNVIKNDDHHEWVRATGKLTQTLRGQYDAVWFKGKGIRTLLDGDQVVVFDPRRIYRVDAKLSAGLEIGAPVVHTQNLDIINRYAQRVPQNTFKSLLFKDALELFPVLKAVYGKYLATRGDWTSVISQSDLDTNDVRLLHSFPQNTMSGVIIGHSGPWYTVKWKRGGTGYNYTEDELKPLIER
jgi:hypothetical protein